MGKDWICKISPIQFINIKTEIQYYTDTKAWPRGYKTFFVLNSVEHEILNAHKYKNIKKFGLFKAQLILECYFSRSYMLEYCWHFNIYEREKFHAQLS